MTFRTRKDPKRRSLRVEPPRGRPKARRRDTARRRNKRERNNAGVVMAAYRHKDEESSATDEESTAVVTACAYCSVLQTQNSYDLLY